MSGRSAFRFARILHKSLNKPVFHHRCALTGLADAAHKDSETVLTVGPCSGMTLAIIGLLLLRR
jgi:hypothetical protein